jgi:CRISPR-associated exonuclease Cas4
MQITGTHFNYFQVCHRKLWFFANNIQMEHTSDLVYEGKLVHESSFVQRASRYEEIEIEGIKIDYFDTKNKVVHGIKKSDKLEQAHVWQLKYYIYVLKNKGMEGVSGILEYPKLRKRDEVLLSQVDKEQIEEMLDSIRQLIQKEEVPPLQKKSICRNCSYHDLCYAGETDE